MVSTSRASRNQSYDSEPPQTVSAREYEHVRSFLDAAFPERSSGSLLCAVAFPIMGGTHYILFTEQLRDVASIVHDSDGKIELKRFGPGGGAPTGRRRAPKPLGKEDWDRLARTSCYRRTLYEAPSERGRELAGSLYGAKFQLAPNREVIVVTHALGIAVDIFVDTPRAGLRRVVNLALDD